MSVYVVVGMVGAAAAGVRGEGLSGEMEGAVKQLGEGSYAAREAGVEAVRGTLRKEMGSLLAGRDTEGAARLAELMEYEEALARFGLEALKLPREEREGLLKWGLSKEHAGLIARAYADRVDKRVEASRELAKVEGAPGSWLLGQLLKDGEREVYLAAMETAWDRRPVTTEVVDALWARAVESGTQANRVQTQGVKRLMFRGRNVGNVMAGQSFFRLQQDNNLATETLVALRDPLIVRKLEVFFEQMGQATAAQREVMFNTYGSGTVNVYKLVETYQPKSLVPALVGLATGPAVQTNKGNIGKVGYSFTNRTWPLGMVVTLTGQSVEEYKMRRLAQVNNMWTFSDEKEEAAGVEMLKGWWEKHKGEYPGAATQAAATQGVGRVMIQGGGAGAKIVEKAEEDDGN